MKKSQIVCLLLVIIFFSVAANAQSKVIKKTVKKVVTPQITSVAPPKTTVTPEVVQEVPTPPPPPQEVRKPETTKGLFGWGLNSDISAKLLYGSILLGARGDIIFSDPWALGEKIGLAEDAVEYKLGLGVAGSDKLKTIPLFADINVYLKEGSLFGLDPYIGTGLIYNLYGTGHVSGGLGGQVYLGMLANLGFESRTGFTLGYATYKVGENLSDSGIYLSVCQPIKL